MAKLRVSMGNIQENLGKALAPAFAQLASTLQPLIERFAEWAEKNPELLAKIILIGGGIASLTVVLGTLGLILPPIIAGFALLAGAILAVTWPMVAIVASIAAVGAGIYLLWQNWDKVMASISSTTESALSFISDLFHTTMDAVFNTISTAWEGIKAYFFTAVNFIIGLYASLFDYLVPGWDGMLVSLWESVSRIFGQIVEVISFALGAIGAKFGEWFVAFKEIWTALWESSKTVFESIWDSIKSVFDSVVDGIKSSMESLVKPIQKVINLAERAYALAGGVVKKAGGYVSSTVSSILDRGSSITGKATGGPVSGNTPYIVGEAGPELFVPGTAGRIIPNNQMAVAEAGAPNIYLTITGNSFMGEREMAEKIGDQIIKLLKTNARL